MWLHVVQFYSLYINKVQTMNTNSAPKLNLNWCNFQYKLSMHMLVKLQGTLLYIQNVSAFSFNIQAGQTTEPLLQGEQNDIEYTCTQFMLCKEIFRGSFVSLLQDRTTCKSVLTQGNLYNLPFQYLFQSPRTPECQCNRGRSNSFNCQISRGAFFLITSVLLVIFSPLMLTSVAP